MKCRSLRLLIVVGAAVLGCSAEPRAQLFSPAENSPFPAGDRPVDVVTCDLDGDGNIEILAANQDSEDVTVLMGDGLGGFRPGRESPVPVGIEAHLIVCADLTGDGHPDAAVTSHDDHDVLILPGDGRGAFKTTEALRVTASSVGEPHNHGLLAIDLDKDGDLDFVTTNQNEESLTVLFGDGTGGFESAPGSPFAVGRMPYLPATGDANGDGRLDLAAPNARGNDVTILLGNADGGFAPASTSPIPTGSRPYYVALADLDEDGKLDLITSHAETSRLTVLLGDGTGGFSAARGSPVEAGNRGYKVRVGDVNGDGHADLVTSGLGRGASVLLGDGQGNFEPAPGSPFDTGSGAWGIALADVNGDGKLDIVTSDADDNTGSVLLAN